MVLLRQSNANCLTSYHLKTAWISEESDSAGIAITYAISVPSTTLIPNGGIRQLIRTECQRCVGVTSLAD